MFGLLPERRTSERRLVGPGEGFLSTFLHTCFLVCLILFVNIDDNLGLLFVLFFHIILVCAVFMSTTHSKLLNIGRSLMFFPTLLWLWMQFVHH